MSGSHRDAVVFRCKLKEGRSEGEVNLAGMVIARPLDLAQGLMPAAGSMALQSDQGREPGEHVRRSLHAAEPYLRISMTCARRQYTGTGHVNS